MERSEMKKPVKFRLNWSAIYPLDSSLRSE